MSATPQRTFRYQDPTVPHKEDSLLVAIVHRTGDAPQTRNNQSPLMMGGNPSPQAAQLHEKTDSLIQGITKRNEENENQRIAADAQLELAAQQRIPTKFIMTEPKHRGNLAPGFVAGLEQVSKTPLQEVKKPSEQSRPAQAARFGLSGGGMLYA